MGGKKHWSIDWGPPTNDANSAGKMENRETFRLRLNMFPNRFSFKSATASLLKQSGRLGMNKNKKNIRICNRDLFFKHICLRNRHSDIVLH